VAEQLSAALIWIGPVVTRAARTRAPAPRRSAGASCRPSRNLRTISLTCGRRRACARRRRRRRRARGTGDDVVVARVEVEAELEIVRACSRSSFACLTAVTFGISRARRSSPARC
jgi:hypothetical protein